jgi:hypothetical protein
VISNKNNILVIIIIIFASCSLHTQAPVSVFSSQPTVARQRAWKRHRARRFRILRRIAALAVMAGGGIALLSLYKNKKSESTPELMTPVNVPTKRFDPSSLQLDKPIVASQQDEPLFIPPKHEQDSVPLPEQQAGASVARHETESNVDVVRDVVSQVPDVSVTAGAGGPVGAGAGVGAARASIDETPSTTDSRPVIAFTEDDFNRGYGVDAIGVIHIHPALLSTIQEKRLLTITDVRKLLNIFRVDINSEKQFLYYNIAYQRAWEHDILHACIHFLINYIQTHPVEAYQEDFRMTLLCIHNIICYMVGIFEQLRVLKLYFTTSPEFTDVRKAFFAAVTTLKKTGIFETVLKMLHYKKETRLGVKFLSPRLILHYAFKNVE